MREKNSWKEKQKCRQYLHPSVRMNAEHFHCIWTSLSPFSVCWVLFGITSHYQRIERKKLLNHHTNHSSWTFAVYTNFSIFFLNLRFWWNLGHHFLFRNPGHHFSFRNFSPLLSGGSMFQALIETCKRMNCKSLNLSSGWVYHLS